MEEIIIDTENKEQNQLQDKKRHFMAEFLDYIEVFVFALCFVIILFSCFVRLCVVDGPSMENTLFDNEKLLVSNFAYTPEAGDIVVFHQTGNYYNQPIVKRVIAVEGETVDIKYGYHKMTVTVTDTNGNQRVLEEPYIKMADVDRYRTSYSEKVPEGHLFVLGDNRNHSADSRTDEIGMVDERRVLGKVIFRVLPFSRIGTVD